MCFVTQDDVFAAIEPVLAGVFEEFGKAARRSPSRPSRASPMTRRCSKYGTDKPDLRNPIAMSDASEIFRGSGFKLFAGMLAKDAECAGLGDPGAGRRQPRASSTA